MGSISKRPLKAFVRFDGSGRVVAGSLVLRRKKPKVGNWQEITAYECCNPTTTTTTTVKSYPAGQLSSTSDAADACGNTLDIGIFLGLATANVVAIGDTVFMNATGGATFNGGSLFYRVEAPDGQDWNVQIGTVGNVLASNLCP